MDDRAMTPRSNVLVIAPLRKAREPELRHLLELMNLAPEDVNLISWRAHMAGAGADSPEPLR
jgi:hypothetical protein